MVIDKTVPMANLTTGLIVSEVFGYRGSGPDRQMCVLASDPRTDVVRWAYLRDVIVMVWS